MGSIRMVSTANVQATTTIEPTQTIEFTPGDLRHLSAGTSQKGLLFFKPAQPLQLQSSSATKDFDQNSLIQHLKTSLSRTLDLFTPLAGRLATTKHGDGSISIFVECNNAGVQFVHAVADGVNIADILQPIYVPSIVHSFFPLNEIKYNYQGVSNPLLAVQVTELVDGIFIGCTMNHSVADATSFWNFFNSWSEISRFGNSNLISNPPVFERNFFFNSSYFPIRIPLSNIRDIVSNELSVPQMLERVFHFTKEKINRLKAKANNEAGTDKISSLQSLLAHLWRALIRSRKLDPNQDCNLLLQIGLRTRLQLAQSYFGNAILNGNLTTKGGEILGTNGLYYVALQINKMVTSHTEDKIRNSLEFSIKNPQLISLGDFTSNYTFISSSPRLNVYGNDFGWGRPIAVRSGLANKCDGLIILYPGVDEGSIDIEVCGLPEILEAMGNDSEFMDAVTVEKSLHLIRHC